MVTKMIDDIGVDMEAADQLLDNAKKLEAFCTKVEAQFETSQSSSHSQSWAIPLAMGLGMSLLVGIASIALLF